MSEKKTVHRDVPEDTLRASTEAQVDTKRVDALPPSAEELTNLLREQALTSALPNPPPIPGYHLCWLSTTNTYTPISYYTRLGYVPVKPEEVVGWHYLKEHSATIGDLVSCNEMVLYKTTEDAYQQIMRTVHHEKPNEEAERLKVNLDMLKQDMRDSDGTPLVEEEGDGLDALIDRRVKVGRFG